MANNGIIVSSAHNYGARPTQVKIQNGSQVSVKIISGAGNGKYVATVAGVRVSIRSERALENGEVFKAKLFAKDGTVFLTPVDANKLNLKIENFPLSVVSDSQVFDFFKNLGLPSDSVMLNVFQMMKQLQMKFNVPLFAKLHNFALKFNGKQKTAAEILMILADKGLNFSEEDVFTLLNALENQIDYEKNDEQNKNAKNLLNKINSKSDGWFVIPFYIENCSESDFYAKSESRDEKNAESFNANQKIAKKNREENFSSENSTKKIGETDEKKGKKIGSGNIRILLGKDKKIKILNLTCAFRNKNYYFSLDYKNGNCRKIKANIDDKSLENNREFLLNLKNKIEKLFLNGKIKNKIEIEWSEKSELDGFSCESEEFYSINQKI